MNRLLNSVIKSPPTISIPRGAVVCEQFVPPFVELLASFFSRRVDLPFQSTRETSGIAVEGSYSSVPGAIPIRLKNEMKNFFF